MMTSVKLDQLFTLNRFPEGMALLTVLLYFPVGLVLAVIRIFIGLHAYIIACLLPKMSSFRCAVLRVMCGVLGVVVLEHNDNKSTNTTRCKVLVSNYTSTLDHVALELLSPNKMVSVWDLPGFLMWILGYSDFGAPHGQDTLVNNIKKHCRESKTPVHAFPENASTNGAYGLLKFSSWPFSLDQPVQPVVIQITRPPIFSVSVSVLGSQWWSDIFWFFFVPFSVFHIRYLDSVKRSEDETPAEFARRVQIMMARALGVEPTQYTSADKLDLIKREHAVRSSPRGGSNIDRPVNVQLSAVDRMVNQVKIVLPHVPTRAIQQDLELTKDVDLTITNILEGRVEYTAVEPGVEAERTEHSAFSSTSGSRRGETSSSAAARANQNQMGASFGKTSRERQLSFEERKLMMLESARKRYLAKTGNTSFN